MLKGYWTSYGYMGWVGDHWMMFVSDREYGEYMAD